MHLQALGEHHQIEVLAYKFALFSNIPQAQIAVCAFLDGMDAAAHETHPLLLGSHIGALEVLAIGAHVHEEDGRLQVVVGVLLGDHRLLDGVHAAHGRAVGVVAVVDVPAAHALQPGDLLGLFLVARPHQMAHPGTGGRKDALELQGGDHIGKRKVLVLLKGRGVEGLEAGGQDHRPHPDLALLVLLVVVNGPGRAELHTGLAFALLEVEAVFRVDAVFQGHGLGVFHIGGPAVVEPLVELVGQTLGALGRASPAGDAFGHVHVAGLLQDIHREVAPHPLDVPHLGQGQELDVGVAARFHQLGRKNAHGTVVGGKGLVQLGHDPADGRAFLHHVDEIAGIGQIQGSLDGGDAAAHHHDGSHGLGCQR